MSSTPIHNLQPQQQKLIEQANQLERDYDAFVAKLKKMEGPDGRNLSLAITHGEDAFMRLRRCIALGKQDPGFVAEQKTKEN